MLLNRKCSPRFFAHHVQIQKVETISLKTKAFLKEEDIKNFFELTKFDLTSTWTTPSEAVRLEIHNLQERILQHFEKEDRIVRYSRNISTPQKTPKKEELRIIVALLIYEPFFGHRRQVTTTKYAHLPELFSEKIKNRGLKLDVLAQRRIQRKIYSIAS